MGTMVADRIGNSMKSMLHALSGKHACEVSCVPPRVGRSSKKAAQPDPLSELDTDSLTEQVIAQFGEEVVRREVPIVPQARKKRDAEILKVGCWVGPFEREMSAFVGGLYGCA